MSGVWSGTYINYMLATCAHHTGSRAPYGEPELGKGLHTV